MAGHILFQIDSFTDKLFSGNPAAVCLSDRPISDQMMASFAAEMNLSETAFVFPSKEGKYVIRWFTPTTEVNLCGHATLAAGHAMFAIGLVAPEAHIEFLSRSGDLYVWKKDDRIAMDFPRDNIVEELPSNDISSVLDTDIKFFGRGNEFLIAEVSDADALRGLEPDFNELIEIGAGFLTVTAKSDSSEWDFMSRTFAPSAGVDEDPVTGSAHCLLAPYWAHKLDKNPLVGRQVSHRGGTVYCEVNDNGVHLEGHAVTVFQTSLSESFFD